MRMIYDGKIELTLTSPSSLNNNIGHSQKDEICDIAKNVTYLKL